jgi:hypothetical protein
LSQTGETLLILVDEEFGPVLETVVYLLKSLGVVAAETNLLPPFAGHVCAFDSLDVKVQALCLRVGADGGIARVGEGA